MKAEKLAGLAPASIWGYFEQLCTIPHGSGNTKAISDYLVAFAKAQGLRYIQDELNNVIIFKPGSVGYEDHAPVILQGHMDMVCEKDEDCPIDMKLQGLDVTHDGEYVFAKGTTLGGDDGVAVAYSLALLASKDIPHPPLEVIITVDEEVGMEGAAGIDVSMLQGRTMLNLDNEEEGVFTVSCAGGIRSALSLPVERRVVYGPCVKLTVEGLQGGHSGVEIHKKRANANKVMGEFLDRVQKLMPLCITKISGGAKDNAIPRSCQVTLVAMGMYIERINDVAAQLQKEVRENYDEPEAVVRGDDVDAMGGNALTTESTAKVIALLNAAPNGVQSWSQDIQGLVQTSLNLGIVTLDEEFKMIFAIRSSVNREKIEVLDRLKELAQFYGGSTEERGDYPAWEYKKDSSLQEKVVSLYTEMYGKAPEVTAIHAGLECGLFGEKLPGLDCISLGPDMKDIHTSKEKLHIASTERVWNFLMYLLKNL